MGVSDEQESTEEEQEEEVVTTSWFVELHFHCMYLPLCGIVMLENCIILDVFHHGNLPEIHRLIHRLIFLCEV